MGKQGKLDERRRSLLKGMGALGVLAPVSVGMAADSEVKIPEGKSFAGEMKTFRSSCAMECLHCNLKAYVHKGKLVKVEGCPDTDANGCLRGLSRPRWVDDPLRLTHPLLRVGEKGKGVFKKITWREAFDVIETKIRETLKTHGNKGLCVISNSGNMDSIQNAMGGAFFNYLGGATMKVGSLCCSAVTAAMQPMVGFRYTDTRDTIRDSRYILCWGNNPAVTMQAFYKDYNEAQRKGAQIVVIDPRFSETAAKANRWVPILPGTDIALALGMMNQIFHRNWLDKPFLRAHTDAPRLVDKDGKLQLQNTNDPESWLVYDEKTRKIVRHDQAGIRPALFAVKSLRSKGIMTVLDRVRDEASSWTAKKTQAVTDVPAKTVERLAKDYATSKASMIIQNMSGAQRTEFGTYVVASQFYLALLTGNIGKPGAGVCDAGGATQMVKINSPVAPPPNPPQKIPPIPVSKVGEWILADQPHPINFMWIMTASLMTQWPNTNAVKKALTKVPFVVVADNLMTSTALWADLVLPVTTIFESDSLMAGTRSHYIQLMQKAIEPPGEAKPDSWIFAQLAHRFGFGAAFDQPMEKMIERCLAGTNVTVDQLKKGPVNPGPTPFIPFKDGIFRTPDKKAHFLVPAWQKQSFSPTVTYREVRESPWGSPELAKKYPLMAVQRKLVRNIHSSFGSNRWIAEMQPNEPCVIIHPTDAKSRGIENGDWTIAFNDRGEHRARAKVTEHIKEGVICLDNGWWEQQGGSSSYVTNDQVEVLGNGHCCNSTLVEIRKEKVSS